MSPASCCLFFLRHVSALTSACSLFIPLQGVPRGGERKEAHRELDESFDEAMVLLDEVVEIVTLPQFTRSRHNPFCSQLASTLWDRPRFYQP